MIWYAPLTRCSFYGCRPIRGFWGVLSRAVVRQRLASLLLQIRRILSAVRDIPIAVARHVWGKHWRSKRISVLCDNEAVVGILNKGRSSAKDIMPFMRSIPWSSISHNFIISARHIPGHFNSLADSLSRFNFQTFRSICPEASPT